MLLKAWQHPLHDRMSILMKLATAVAHTGSTSSRGVTAGGLAFRAAVCAPRAHGPLLGGVYARTKLGLGMRATEQDHLHLSGNVGKCHSLPQ
jgi:hypothetical protein